MNHLLICRLLGRITLLIGAAMALSLPWTLPISGEVDRFDGDSLAALLASMALAGLIGGGLMLVGRRARDDRLFRREAIAVVGLSWIMATVLGAAPFWLSGTAQGRAADGRPIPMGVFDGLFESASGFSGTGATVLENVEDPELVPRAILFWRSETHFLGGLGIMVLFVSLLGMGSAGKALMITEMPGPSQEAPHARSQRTARVFAGIFIGLTAILTVLLLLEGMGPLDALCHAFGTIATGGFSTYNDSVEHFHSVPIEMTITAFMAVACVNFTLLYYVLLMRPKRLLEDVEFRVYAIIMLSAAVAVVSVGLSLGDFPGFGSAVRYGLFQVVSIMTNTGFGTANFDRWHSFSRAVLFLLMFVGGCAGSTSCSIKVIRYILLAKILGLELERIYHPSVVRPVRVDGHVVEQPDLRKDVLLYFTVITMLFIVAWMALVAFEPDSTWTDAGRPAGEKLIDCASAVAATLNGVGPGLGIVGESENYAHFHGPAKLILTIMMLLGRLEVFAIAVLLTPRFWIR